MSRLHLAALTLAVLLSGKMPAALGQDNKDKDSAPPRSVTITHIDTQKGTITVKYQEAPGKVQEKTLRLTRDVRLLDETGRVIQIDVFEAGNEALVVEREGNLREVRRTPGLSRNLRFSNTVRTLMELADCEQGCAEDLQKIYDMLRKLDTGNNGKIDPVALKAEADSILRERVQEVFGRLDVNKDGKVSKEEARGMIKEHFDRIDKNGDGFLPLEELLQAARERHELQPATKQTDAKSAGKEKK